MEKIDREQLLNLMKIIDKYQLLIDWVKGLCQVEYLEEITVVQYNFLLVIIQYVVNRND